MPCVEDKDLREYLQTFRSRKDVQEKFDLSNTESWHLLKKSIKYKEVEEINLTGMVPHYIGVLKVYRWVDEK